MAGNRNSGMCSPLCSDVCAFYLPQGLTLYFLLYKPLILCTYTFIMAIIVH